MYKNLIRPFSLFFVLAVASYGFTQDQTETSQSKMTEDEAAVYRAVQDYVEGVYQVKPELIERSVHPDLKKFGFWRAAGEENFRDGSSMTFEQLKAIASTYNKNGHVPKDAPKEIQVFDVMDQIACAKLTAHWGSDYFQLVKENGKWKILQIVWQSPMRK